MQIKASYLALGLSALVASAPVAAANIVTSIKPLELIVKAVAGDEAKVTTLVPAGSSPHNYTMKPSQRRALEQSDVIFWVGPEMETFLNRLLSGREFQDRAMAFMEGPETDNEEDHHDHHDDHHGHHDHHDDHGHREDAHAHHHHHDHGDGEDPHIWIDPALALEMAKDVRTRLATLDGMNADQLDANLARFEESLAKAEQDIRARLSGAQNISLFAYHDAFTRYAEHYGLTLDGVLTLNPELSPGARHIAEVQRKLQQANQPCLLTEPQFNRQWWRSITEGLDVTFSTWDPLATDIESNAEGYINFQYSIADAVTNCLPK
ncbi:MULTISPECIES: zinc ABC transporter substrate-binding protein [unclassified Marinobacter]|uniref:High-affinity zinc uptake system protein ZnuA n=1 Tax=Marinobacter nauticus TaxID=2743 RepID=A0A455WA39_MARNT|nr:MULTISPECIES: zinc ABC transporter substrate-binding protein [unclassified Marinobacter]QFS86685.1 High-affinity zinc uptake system protein ZnuA precursor [Marinobacter sp. THAF197a]QFT50469.1 High-affinity zinc uptake system protein ZnuA precursor [Marinobacter sp. THAF39]BBJ03565.1 zinc ABC transporter substrate-binding protein [Marinobacter nauticus]